MDSDTDDDAILLDRALNGVCHEDLHYLMIEFGVELPPVGAKRQPSSIEQYQRYHEKKQESEYVITNSVDVQSNSDLASVPEHDSSSEFSVDDHQVDVPSIDVDNSDCAPTNCASCDNPKSYIKIYGINFCSACRFFIHLMVKQKFKTNCIGGQGNCRTIYSEGDPIRCQSCRLRKMMRLNIQHPAWIRFKTTHGIIDYSTPQDGGLDSEDDDKDRESTTSRDGNSSSGEYCSPKSSIHEQELSETQSNHDQSGCEPPKCASCGAPNEAKCYGINLCNACVKFIFKIPKKKFKVDCIVGLGRCRVTYKAGLKIRCPSCRLKNMMKLDIRHPSWIEYKSKQGYKVTATQQDGANLFTRPCDSKSEDDGDGESMTSSHSHSSGGEYKSSPSSNDEQAGRITSSKRSKSSFGLFKCAGCGNPKKYKKIYGINLCSACMKFISRMARRDFETICVGGQGNCRVTYSHGDPIKCQSCRLRNMLRLDIRNPAWIRYRAELGIRTETPSDDDEDIDSILSSSKNSSNKESSSQVSYIDGQQGNIAAPSHGQDEIKLSDCDGCKNPRISERVYGLNLCYDCRRFIIIMQRQNFKVSCIGGRDNCRTTYTPTSMIRCQSCKLNRMMRLNIGHPAWVRYRAKLKINSKTLDEPARHDGEPYPDGHKNAKNRKSMLLSHDNPSNKHNHQKSIVDQRKESAKSSNHDQSGSRQVVCASCSAPKQHTYHGVDLCGACKKFAFDIVKKNFKASCNIGRDNCRTTYKPGYKIRCPSCRLKKMMKLDIKHPAWIEHKATYGCKTAYNFERQNDANLLNEQHNSKNQSGCERPKCAGCGRLDNYRYHGLYLCSACRMFVCYVADKKNFNAPCQGGQGNCRTTYVAGIPLNCPSCRIKKLMRLDIRHPAWVRYKSKHKFKIDSESVLTIQNGGVNEQYSSQEHTIGGPERIIESSDNYQSGSKQSVCASCSAPNKLTYYGMNLCSTCQKFVFNTAKRNFKASCIDGRGFCRTTYKPGLRISCPSCRLKKMMKLDIQHPAWIKYKATHACRSDDDFARLDGANLSIDELHDPNDIQGGEDRKTSLRRSNSGGKDDSSLISVIERRKKTSTNLDLSGCERPKCAGCGRLDNYRYHGLYLCNACRMFVCYVADKKKFNAPCHGEQGNCRTTYVAGIPLSCPSCRIKKLMRLDIRHPAWVRYKAKHRITSKSCDNPTRHDEERDSDSADEDRGSMLSTHEDRSKEECGFNEHSIDRREGSIESSNHGESGSKQVVCASCYAPNKLTYYGMNLCIACQKFTFKIAKRNFKARCIGGNANCRTTYKPGYRMTCASCRIKRMMKLNIQHPLWIKYKAKLGCDKFTRRDGALLLNEPHGSNDIQGRQDSATSRHSKSSAEKVIFDFDRPKKTSTNLDLSGRGPPRCAGCDRSDSSRCYGLYLCSACRNFVAYVAVKNNLDSFRCEGQGTCRTTYLAGIPMKCTSCRIKKLMQFDIRHPTWVRHKSKHGITGKACDNPTRHDEARNLESDAGDKESMSLIHINRVSKKYRSEENSIDRCKGSINSPNETGSRQFVCSSCSVPNKRTYRGMNLCKACQRFVFYMADRNFKSRCIRGNGNCRTTHKPDYGTSCTFCRLKKMMKLDIPHPAWIRYKAKNGYKIADNFTRRDDANLLNEPHDPNDIQDDEDSTNSRQSNSSGEENSSSISSSVRRNQSSLKLDQSGCERPKCVGCNAPHSCKCYGLMLCKACQSFVSYVALNENFHIQCREGQGNCRTTYIAGNSIKCPSCRIKKLMEFNIQHPVWIKYKAKHEIKSEASEDSASHDEKLDSDEDDMDMDMESVISSHNEPNIEEVDEALVEVGFKSLIGPGEDCDADDEIEVMEIDCD